MRTRTAIQYFIATLVVVLVFIGLFLAYRPPKTAVVATGIVEVARDGEPLPAGPVPWYAVATDREGFRPGRYRFTVSMELPNLNYESPYLVLPLMAGSSLAVKVNGEQIGSRGDRVAGESSIWNAAHMFPVPLEILTPTTRVDIEILGRYEAGLLRTPYIVERRAARGRLFALLFYSTYAVLLLAGASLLVSLIILGSAVAVSKEKLPRLLVGIAGILTAITLFDYALLESLPFSLLFFKKTVIGARHLAAATLVGATTGFLDRRRDPLGLLFIGVQIVCVLVIAIGPSDIAQLKRVYSVTFFLALPFLLYVLALAIIAARHASKCGAIVFGTLVAFFTSGFDIVSMAMHPERPFISHFGMVILTASVAAFVVLDLFDHYELLIEERQRSRFFLRASIQDQLTGLYNRRAFSLVATELVGVYSVIAVDLDNFKQINDEFGHEVGDDTLRHVARLIRDNLRSGDYVVRIGGDEMVAVLPSCPEARAIQLAHQIEENLRTAPVPGPTGTVCTASIGVAGALAGAKGGLEELQSVLLKADQALYTAKRAGKARVAVASSPI